MSKEIVTSFSESTHEGFNKLIAMGIQPEMLKAACLQEEDYQVIYRPFVLLVHFSYWRKSFLITQAWELQALSGNITFYKMFTPEVVSDVRLSGYAALSAQPAALDWIKEHAPNLLMQKDDIGRTLAHYAALSGQPAPLDWIKEHAPDLLMQKNNDGATLAHYAAFSGQPAVLDWMKEHALHLLMEQNIDGRTLAHYAAWSGQPAALDWIKEHAPNLLMQKDNDGRTLAHYAALSGQPAALDWMKEHAPHLILQKNRNGTTLAHDAASLSQPAALDWIKEHAPQLLMQKDNKGRTLAHYAALSGQPAALDWIKEHAPHLLMKKNNKGATLACYAAYSGDPAWFNHALQYTTTPSAFIFVSDPASDLSALHCINQALDNNLTLMRIKFSKTIQDKNPELVQSIMQKISRNQAISSAMKQFTAFLCGELPDILPREILRIILEKFLPTGIPANLINQLLNQAIIESLPDNRINEKINSEIRRLEKSNRQTSWLIALGIMKSADDQIRRLTALKRSLDHFSDVSILNSPQQTHASLQTVVSHWLKENTMAMEEKHSRLHAFFRPQHHVKAGTFIEAIKTDLRLS